MSKDKNLELDLQEKLEAVDISFIMGTVNGRRFLWRLLSFCGIYQDIEVSEPHVAAKQAGRRQVGLYLLGILSERNQEEVFKMMREAQGASEMEEQKYVNNNIEPEQPEQSNSTGDDREQFFAIPTGAIFYDREPSVSDNLI